ncbi:6708_t:CDS:2, partial [Dentiscutata erythropus]
THNRMPNIIITDGDPAMKRAVITEYPETQHFICIWHIKENFKKMLHGKLGNQYSIAKQYLKHQLYKRRSSWACAFSALVFTLGIQSISFVESQNSYIKRVINNSNISLCDIGKILIERSEEERKHKLIEEWKNNIPNTTCISTQMKESIYYVSNRTTIEAESLKVQEPSQIDDFNNDQKINHIVFLLENVSYMCTCLMQQNRGLLIAKRWIPKNQWHNVSKERVYRGQRFNNNTMSLDININILDSNITNLESNEEKFKWLCPFNSSNDIVEETTTNDAFVEEQLFYRNVWGLNYLKKIHRQEEELVRTQEAHNNMSSNNFTEQHQNTISTENVELSTQFKNSRKVFVRVRPKSASHRNQTSGSANNKKKQGKQGKCGYKCRICKKSGHNAATSSKIIKSDETNETDETDITEE